MGRKKKRVKPSSTEKPIEKEVAEDEPKPHQGKEWLKSILIAAVLFLVIRTFFVQTFVITSGSMKNTLLVGDMLVANRLAMGPRIPGTSIKLPGYSAPRRGDVLVFDPHHEAEDKLIKRLVGLPGDTLRMRDGVLSVNGVEQAEAYLNPNTLADQRSPDFEWQRAHVAPGVDPATYAPSLHSWGPLVVPDGHYFMLGDNRDESLDSRYWGPLATWRVEARAFFIYFSYNGESYRPFPALREIHWGRLASRIRGS